MFVIIVIPEETMEGYCVYYVSEGSAPPVYCGFNVRYRVPSRKKTEPPDFDLFGSLQMHIVVNEPESPDHPGPGMKSEPDRGT